MIRINKDGRHYWAEIIDLDEDRTIGVTFRHTNREYVRNEAVGIQKTYDEKKAEMQLSKDEDDLTPTGSVWRTEIGTEYVVIRRNREHYVTVARIDGGIVSSDTYVWHVSSLTKTSTRRIK